MFYNKLTRKEKEDKLFKIIKMKENIEYGFTPHGNSESKLMITSWKGFLKLPFERQASIRKEWEDYYIAVRQTPIYLLMQEMREASRKITSFTMTDVLDEEVVSVKNEATKKFIDLSNQSREMRQNGHHLTLIQPRSIDPWEYNRGWVKAYKDCEITIKELNTEMDIPASEEARDIWSGQSV